MMRRRLAHLPALFVLCCLSAPALAQRLVDAPQIGEIAGPFPVAHVVEFRIADDDLVIGTRLEPTGGMKRVGVRDLPGTTRVNVNLRSRRDIAAVALQFRLMHAAPPADDGSTTQTVVWTRPGYVELTRSVRTPGELLSVSLTQKEPTPGGASRDERVTLRVRRINTTTNHAFEDVQRLAPTVVDLMRAFPRDTARHLGPIFRTFRQEAAVMGADLRRAWQVLADVLPVDEGLAPEIDDLVARLDADDFRVRDRAFRRLGTLGGPAALLLLRRPTDDLTPEQRTKLDAFLAAYRPLTAAEADRHRGDADFLLNCVAYSDEPAIRLAAAEELRARDPDGRAAAAAAVGDREERAALVQQIRERWTPTL